MTMQKIIDIMAKIIDTHKFKDALKKSSASGFTLVRSTYKVGDIKPWEIVTRKYDADHVCVIVFEDRYSAQNELKIFPEGQPYRIEELSYAELQQYHALMGKVSSGALIIFLRSREGQFSILDPECGSPSVSG